jgi:hypothetical protein
MFDICPLCGWEDDGIQNGDPDYVGGANRLSLREHRERWKVVQHNRLEGTV